ALALASSLESGDFTEWPSHRPSGERATRCFGSTHPSGFRRQRPVVVKTVSGPEGQFEIKVASAGEFDIRVDAARFRQVIVTKNLPASGTSEIDIQMPQLSSRLETVTVTADVDGTDG